MEKQSEDSTKEASSAAPVVNPKKHKHSHDKANDNDGARHHYYIKKRNRKRARSARRPNDDESHIQSQVIPLRLHGRKIPGGPEYLRLILPYLYNFTSFAKARWVGRSVLDVYTTEFGGYPPEYYKMAILQGRILVSDQKVDASYIIKATDVLVHCVHRHEPGVAVSTNQPPFIKIVGETDDILAIDKPGTLPIHPCGGYHQNSLMKMLEKQQQGNNKLYTIHRLDRLTGGLVVLGKTHAAAQAWGKAIQQRENCQKLYLARVKGRFPTQCPSNIPNLAACASKPIHGEWPTTTSDDKSDTKNNGPSSRSDRQKNALGYWIEDSFNKTKPEEEAPSLQSFATRTNDIEACLDGLKNKSTNFLWLRFACPVRVVEPKRGVCVSCHKQECHSRSNAQNLSFTHVFVSCFAGERHLRRSRPRIVRQNSQGGAKFVCTHVL